MNRNISIYWNNTKKLLMMKLFLFGCTLFLTTFLVYKYLDDRNIVDSYYGSCMLVSLQGQDNTVENNSAKILIGLLSLLSCFVYAVSIWVHNERYLQSANHNVNIRCALLLGIPLVITTFLTYFLVDDRDFIDSFYGTCMLISLQGQDETPTSDMAKILIGNLSIISSLLFGVMAWLVIEYYAIKKLEMNDFETIPGNQFGLDNVDMLLIDK